MVNNPNEVLKMLALRKDLDPCAPDAVVLPAPPCYWCKHPDHGDKVCPVPQLAIGNHGLSGSYPCGCTHSTVIADYVTLLERNNGRLREVLKEALEQTGCDGDLCLYRWHEKARALLGDDGL